MITAQQLKTAVDPVKLIGETVRLRKVGKRHSGLCPFHTEKTPSFSVNETGLWHCFGCGKGGDIISFLELSEGLDFRGAKRKLASIAGIELDERDTFSAPSLALKLSGPEVRAFDRWLSLKQARLYGLWRFVDDQHKACMTFLEGFFNAEDIDRAKVEAVHAELTRTHEAKALIDEQILKLDADPSFMVEPFLRSFYGKPDFRAEVQGL